VGEPLKRSVRLLPVMKVITVSVLLLLLSCSCCRRADESIASKAERNADELGRVIEPKLASIIPQGWSLVRSGETFALSSNEKVFLYNPVGVDVGKTEEENAKQNGVEENYVIELKFEPLITREEYERLVLERKPFETLVNGGARTKDEWWKAVVDFYRHRVPIYYTEKFTVFARKSDDYPTKVYPGSVASEGKRVVSSLDGLFQRYEKILGRNSDF
jgi:hypothetical protein